MNPPPFIPSVIISPTLIGLGAFLTARAADNPRPEFVGYAVGFTAVTLSHAAWMLLHSERVEVVEPDNLRAAVRGMWTRADSEPDEGGLNTYPLEVRDGDGLYKITGTRSPQISVSKSSKGGPPYLVLPAGIGRWQVEAFHDACIRDRQPPTEKLLVGSGKPFSQLSLRAWRNWFLAHQWAVHTRRGNNAPWVLTPRGMRVMSYIYFSLQGKVVSKWIEERRK